MKDFEGDYQRRISRRSVLSTAIGTGVGTLLPSTAIANSSNTKSSIQWSSTPFIHWPNTLGSSGSTAESSYSRATPSELERQWQHEYFRLETGVIASHGVIIFGSGSTLYAIDEVSGEALWDHQFEDSIAATPAISGRTVVAGDESTMLVGIDVVSGTIEWKTTLETPCDRIESGTESVFVLSANRLNEFDATTGETRTTREVPNPRPESLCVHDDAYLVVRGGRASRVTSKHQWTTEIEDLSSASLTVTEDRVLAWQGDAIIAFDASSGEYRWKRILDRTVYEDAAVARGFLVVSTWEEVIAFAVHSGEELWSRKIDETIITPPSILVSSVLVGTVDGIKSFHLGSGSEGPYDIDVLAMQRPVVGPESVLVVTGDGLRLYQSPESVEAKSRIVSGRRLFEHDDPSMTADGEVFETYESAADAFLEGSFYRAESIARDLETAYRERLSVKDETSERIEELETRIEALLENYIDDSLRRELRRAEEYFENRRYEKAIETAENTLAELSEVERHIDRASAAISDLEGLIEQAHARAYDVSEAEEQLRAAKESYRDGGFEDALEEAETGIEQISDRVDTAEEARKTIVELNERIQATRYDVSKERKLVRDAELAYEADKYDRALATAERADEELEETVQRVESARNAIDTAKELDTRHTGVRYAADQFGYTERLQEARRAYDDDEYDAAIRSAKRAEQAYHIGRWLVDGSIGGAMSAVLLYKVRPDLIERPARRTQEVLLERNSTESSEQD